MTMLRARNVSSSALLISPLAGQKSSTDTQGLIAMTTAESASTFTWISGAGSFSTLALASMTSCTAASARLTSVS